MEEFYGASKLVSAHFVTKDSDSKTNTNSGMLLPVTRVKHPMHADLHTIHI